MKRRETDRLAHKHMWHAHHWPDEYERCVHVGGRPICRRCLTLYPAAVAVAIAYLGGLLLWPVSADPWLIWALCLPATADFVLEQLGVIRYSARRQVVTTALLAPALGRGMGYELADTWSWEFWGPVLVFCNVWFWATTAGKSRRAKLELANG
ncbi:MAG: hypothetical protein AAGE98_13940 [Actinomycetota bacterium]